ncbi:2-oxoglutarate dehydrogenase E1 component [Roseateles sp.]|uniref:2-oxoglutarate dehydrogenase E1 component n=1 Tax=Roseateles sp. TaxID=1971397 RepID=UPI002F42AB3C
MSVNTSFGRHAWALRCRFDRDTDPSEAIAPSAASPSFSSSDSPRLRPGIAALIDAFRRHGHRHARLDPLGDPPGVSGADPVRRAGFGSDVVEDVDAFHLLRFGLAAEDSVTDDGATVLGVADAGALHRRLSALYCGSLTLDLSAVRDESRRAWWSARFEADDAPLSTDAARALLRRLARVEGWERHLAKRFPHGKRFSLEGNEALLPLLDTLLEAAVAQGVDQVLMGMPHRGRVNVLANLMGHPVDALIDYFEPAPAHPERQRDLVYHLGGTSRVQTAHGAVRLRLASNPSHLQSVYPVVVGMARAARSAAGERPERCMAVVMHGDAAFAGQGVVMETLALGLKPGYEVGGVIHVVINNQLGFTEPNPMDATSARYCTDATRGVDAPVLRVHADDPEAVLRAARLAVDYRARFGTDVVIDLVGYRRLGHSEHDVPQLTSPALYRRMPAKAGVTALYAERLTTEQRLRDDESAAIAAEVDAFDPTQPLDSAAPIADDAMLMSTLEKRAPIGDLHDVLEALAQLPEGFDPHALLRDQASRWRGMADDARRPADWCTAETLAWAQVLRAGVGVRISGLDVQRGTFLHRHAVWHHQGREVDTGGLSVAGEGEKRGDPRIGGPSTWTPLSRFASEGARLEVVNSLLAEEAVLGFEYGHSVQSRDVMTVWEAQFGDFVNGAQVYLDQYLSSGEEKWGDTSALTVLLPHGYEGVGPEHSNGFLARLLQLCGADNLRVAMPSTSGQYAALLQRQALDPVRKPLIVMTPKAVLLGEPRSYTPVGVLAASGFEPVLDDDTVDGTQAGAVRRVVLSSGKVHYDLLSARQAMAGSLADPMAGATALVRVEQLYPFPREALAAVLQRYPLVEEIVWTQEETRNQGPWHFVRDELDGLLPAGARLREVSRAVTAAGATASPVIHRWQQAELVRRAFLT